MKEYLSKIKGKLGKYFLIVVFVTVTILGMKELFFTETTNIDIKKGKMTELTKEEKIQDFNYMFNILKDNYPYFEIEKRMFGYDWLSKEETFRKIISETKNNSDFFSSMDSIINSIQNRHTHLIQPDFYEELRAVYGEDRGTPAWKDFILNKDVEKRYDYWKNVVEYNIKYVPIYFKYMEGNYIVCSNLNPNEDELKKNKIIPGSILEEIDFIPVDEYVKTMISSSNLSYDYKRKKPVIRDLVIISQSNSEIELTIKDTYGKTNHKAIKCIDNVSLNNNSQGKEDESNFLTKIIQKDKIAYIKFRSFDTRFIDKDAEGVFKFYHEIKDYPYLIIDIRGNLGGSYNYWADNIISPLTEKTLNMEYIIGFRDGEFINRHLEDIIHWGGIKTIKSLPEGKVYPPELKDLFHTFFTENITIESSFYTGFKGKIYILVDEYVYSAAEGFAAFAKSTGWGTLVGTTTGGDGIGYDPAYAVLPNSGLLIRFPIGIGLNPDGAANEENHTSPDIYVEQSRNDYLKMKDIDDSRQNEMVDQYDTILKSVLKMIK